MYFLRKWFFEVAMVIHNPFLSTSIVYSHNFLWKYSLYQNKYLKYLNNTKVPNSDFGVHSFIGNALHWFQQGFVWAGVLFDCEPPENNRNSNYVLIIVVCNSDYTQVVMSPRTWVHFINYFTGSSY